MGVMDKLVAARALLERAREVPVGERDWLLALAWGELAEGAAAFSSALDAADAGDTRDVDRLCGPVRWRRDPTHAAR